MAKTVQAPPWLARLMTPFIARTVARGMMEKYAGLTREEVRARMLADVPSGSAPEAYAMVDEVVARLPEVVPAASAEAAGPGGLAPSAWLLLAANLVPLYGVLAWDWQVFPLLALFWMENVVIGVLNAARMLAAAPEDLTAWAGKLFLVPFFCLHYGMFTLGHGTFVFSGFLGGKYPVDGLNVLPAALQAAGDFNLWAAAAVLAASHLFSFFWNYLYKGEFRRATLDDLMKRPYVRVVVLHVTIILGGIGAMVLGSPVWALAMLVGLKTAMDVAAHRREHRKAGTIPA